MKLNTEWVDHIFKECMFTDKEVDETPQEELLAMAVKVQGIVNNVGFHPVRLETNKRLIAELLKELPLEFHKNSGGGMTFLKAPFNKNGGQWGEQADAEKLILLGIGAGLAKFPLPKEMWAALPGGVPYVEIDVA